MNEESDSSLTYIINDKGIRELDKKSKVKQQKLYFAQGGLYPFDVSKKNMSKICYQLEPVDINEPYILIWSENYFKAVFSALLLKVNKIENAKGKYVHYKVVDLQYLMQLFMNEDCYDISQPFNNYKVLLVKLSTDTPHMYNAYIIRNLAQARKDVGKYTFFFYNGTLGEIMSDKWKLDDQGDGRRSVIYDEKGKTIDSRTLIPITNFVPYFDMNTGKVGGKK